MNIRKTVETRITKSSLFAKWYERERFLARFSLGVLALIPLLLLGFLLDERTLNDINIWVKPIKFNVAIFIYLATLVWFSGWIDQSAMRTRYYRLYTWILIGSMITLFTWLYSAALMGELAHYNRTHPILAPVYGLMGMVSVTFTAGTVVVGTLIAINVRSPLGRYFRYTVVWSLFISFVFTVLIAGELASMDSHWIGGTASDKHGLPLLGWSRDGGDLRVAHFFSLHAMQIMPLVALWRLPARLTTFPGILALILSLTYVCFILFVYFQAKQGLAFLPWLG